MVSAAAETAKTRTEHEFTAHKRTEKGIQMVANTNSNAGPNAATAKGSNTMATPTNSSANRPGSTPARNAAAIEDKPRVAPAAQAKVDAAKAEQQKGKIAAIGRAMEAI